MYIEILVSISQTRQIIYFLILDFFLKTKCLQLLRDDSHNCLQNCLNNKRWVVVKFQSTFVISIQLFLILILGACTYIIYIYLLCIE